MTDKVKFTVVSMPMGDTGIGREAGFRDDAHLIEVAKAEREALPQWQREIMDEIDKRRDRALLYGDDTTEN